MSATATAAPELPTQVALPIPPPSAAAARATQRARAILVVALAWTAAILSAASYVEGWQRRNPAPVASGTTIVRHP